MRKGEGGKQEGWWEGEERDERRKGERRKREQGGKECHTLGKLAQYLKKTSNNGIQLIPGDGPSGIQTIQHQPYLQLITWVC